MKKLLQTLTETAGPAGYEDEVREVLRREVKSLADEVRVDALGNLIAWKRPGKAAQSARRIMIAAHMDETGFMVRHVDENGFIRFTAIGSVHRQYLAGARVRFLSGTRGVIGCDCSNDASELPALDRFHIDVGVTSCKDCPVKVGDVAVFDGPYHELGACLVAKSMDNRVGVLVALETLRNLKSTPYEISFVFTTQQQAGARGAVTAAYAVNPEIAIALDVSPAADTLHSRGEIVPGKGPCIRIQEAGTVFDTRVVNWMIRTAEKNKIVYQREISQLQNTDAAAIQFARAGVLSGCLSVPARYLPSSSEMVDLSDVQNAVRLLTVILRTQIEL